jgi:hypothetical protein
MACGKPGRGVTTRKRQNKKKEEEGDSGLSGAK